MIIIKRIGIKGGKGTCADKAYPFVKNILKRRYGNSVTFAFDWEVQDIINQLKIAGFKAYEDGFIIKLSDCNDFKIGETIYLKGMIGDIPMIVKELKDDSIHGKIAKVKYVNYPRKHGIWVKIKKQEELENEILSYGLGMLEAYKQHN